jgi:hypothetical protein
MKKQGIPRYLCVPDLKPSLSPQWIPIPLQLLDDYRLVGLREIDRWHYIAICLLAARCGNRLRGDAAWISQRIRAGKPVDLRRLIDAKLLASAGERKIQASTQRQVRFKSRHEMQTLRQYAASKPNARNVRELAGFFARTGAADDEVDAWLTEQNASQAAETKQRERESNDERRQFAELLSEIAARGGPRDEVERMIWEAKPAD